MLPDIDAWRREFAAVVNGSYLLRGIEMTLDGPVTGDKGLLTVTGNANRPPVVLAPIDAMDKVQWNLETHSNWPVLPGEQTAYERPFGVDTGIARARSGPRDRTAHENRKRILYGGPHIRGFICRQAHRTHYF